MIDMSVQRLGDQELLATVSRLAGREREATAALIICLAEIDSRRLYEGAGFSSLFQYCVTVLHLSEGAAYNRIETARAVRRFPAVLDMLVSGALSPTTARLIARRLTTENHQALLAESAGKGRYAVEELLARRFPRPDVPASVRPLPSGDLTAAANAAAPSPTCVSPAPTSSVLVGSEGLVASPDPPAVLDRGVRPPPRPVVRPVAAERYEFRFTGGAGLRDRLREAQDLLGHAIPSGDLAAVFDRALTLLVEDLRRKKFAEARRPRPRQTAASDARHVPAAVRREVAARDGGCCAFVAADGRRCDGRRFLEFHHVIPYAVGGPATLENIQLRCRAHNGHEVERFFGPDKRWRRPDPERKTVASDRFGATSIQVPMA